MTTFSELYGYKPDRSRLHQFEEMGDPLRNAIWNFLWKNYFGHGSQDYSGLHLGNIWIDVVGEPYDDLYYMGNFNIIVAKQKIRQWYFKASWHEVYDVLEYLLSKTSFAFEIDDANAILSREGAAYRFIGGAMAPITNDEELAEVQAVVRHTGPFDGASQHISQAVMHLSNRDNPDARNAIKEAISAVESAVGIASGDQKAGVAKALQKLGLHPQLERAWNNMYNWTSDEDGVRHAMKELPQVGLAEARYMVVACSAFVNYLVARDAGEA